MLRVGLTGGVASGKSRVAALLAEFGAAVKDADDIVAALYRPRGAGTAAVARQFGPAVLAADGAVDRERLAARVLADPPARRRLEELIHPLVQQVLATWLDTLAGAPSAPPVAVVEAALLVETGSWRWYDRLVVVEAPLELRWQRARAAGWSEQAFTAVVAAQVEDVVRRAVASYVLINSGGETELSAKASRLWQALLSDEQRRGANLQLLQGVTVLA